jgi:pantothenate kinase type III
VDRTPYLENTERTVPPCITLNRFLSEQATTYIFGAPEVNLSTAKNAAKMAILRKIPALSVYILVATTTSSSDITEMVQRQEADIAYLFRDVPVRLLRLTTQHFLSNHSQQPMLTSSRAAALYVAMKNYGTPTLLIDAGVTMSYLAIDKNSAILGGGVGMGLKLRFDSLFDYSGMESIPEISYDSFRQTIEEAMQQKKPIPLFAGDPAISMMGAAVSEAAGQLRNIVNQFLEQLSPTAAGTATSNMNTPLTVAITGDDTPFVRSLFHFNCSHICEPEPGTKFPAENKMKIAADTNLMSMGISCLLHAKSMEKNSVKYKDNLRNQVLGLRGARAEALLVDYERNPGIYRGTIVRVVRGKKPEEDSYEIVFDNDGEKELLTPVELYGT